MDISNKNYTMIDAHLILSLYDDDRSLQGGSLRFKDVTEMIGAMEDDDEIHFHHLNGGLIILSYNSGRYLITGNNNENLFYDIKDSNPDGHTWLRLMSMLTKDILRKYRYTLIEVKSSSKGEQ